MSETQQTPTSVEQMKAIAARLGKEFGASVCVELKAWWFGHITAPRYPQDHDFRVWVSRPNTDGEHYIGKTLRSAVDGALRGELATSLLAELFPGADESGDGEQVASPAAVDPVAATE